MPKYVDHVDDIRHLLSIFPKWIRDLIVSCSDLDSITEIVVDLGSKLELRFAEKVIRFLETPEITQNDIDTIVKSIGGFNKDNRAGMERTLHRISAIRNRQGTIIGLTCRIGRAIEGTINLIQDIIVSGKNVLFLGPPGIGKTTKLRESARVLADDCHKRVIVVDTSNEIAGDGDIPHHGIGFARRMQVPSPDLQHAVMIEAVENHMPEVIIVDEIGTEAEAMASRTIAERGVQLIATAHGHRLENILKNPTLSDLVGGVQSVILGDEEAKLRGSQKTVLERKTMPTFDVVIEIKERDKFLIYSDVKRSVDGLLRGHPVQPEYRGLGSLGLTEIEQPIVVEPVLDDALLYPTQVCKIYSFGIRVDKLNDAIEMAGVTCEVTQNISDADLALTIRSKLQPKSKLYQMVKTYQIPLHVLKDASIEQLVRFLKNYFGLAIEDALSEETAMEEIKHVCEQVRMFKRPLETSPTMEYLRKSQHEYVKAQKLNSISVGEEPNRRVRVFPNI